MQGRQRWHQETWKDARCQGSSVTAPPPLDSAFSWVCFSRSPALLFHIVTGLTELLLGPRQASSQTCCCQSKKGPDKLCICICIERHFQRHRQGNGLAEYRCYLRMTAIQVILQLHYLSGEIRLVCTFTRIISFKSAHHICPTLRIEATTQVPSKELASVLPTETIFHRHPKTSSH